MNRQYYLYFPNGRQELRLDMSYMTVDIRVGDTIVIERVAETWKVVEIQHQITPGGKYMMSHVILE